ncbi:exported protein of unknown function [Cupriavidus taiwanensis]|uniref:Uncharacterized protein n=1 Tax=Cupriavidus taiwanensis TaxID=164546 RepID=A0A7Z7J837_9BURK|nr:hypothetical protein CBM2585_A40227 [Cupriavidus taiwanensis]SOZ01354.1 hypothetical protein CBM2595_A30225 [Cupriavidus taiwanensis]SOZ04264.1 hypothetical protein CBM2597_A50377 [Cupriavidus taiwanensis]SPC08906.1 hypothetical protein CBM2594_A40229 [Cupriavidus taiwanensis]SPD38697.1 exported protein of unknown function [Cupriavidus taiwanensis]
MPGRCRWCRPARWTTRWRCRCKTLLQPASCAAAAASPRCLSWGSRDGVATTPRPISMPTPRCSGPGACGIYSGNPIESVLDCGPQSRPGNRCLHRKVQGEESPDSTGQGVG